MNRDLFKSLLFIFGWSIVTFIVLFAFAAAFLLTLKHFVPSWF